jgi:hypothetical protein
MSLRGLSMMTDALLFPGLAIFVFSLIGLIVNVANSQPSATVIAGIFLSLGGTLVALAIIGKFLISAAASVVEELREQ